MFGGGAADGLWGNRADDVLLGGDGPELIEGGAGNDIGREVMATMACAGAQTVMCCGARAATSS